MSDRKRLSVARTLRLGAAAVVAAAAGVVGLATPAYAADITPSQTKGPAAGTNKITLTGLIGATKYANDSRVQFNKGTSCPSAPASTNVTEGTDETAINAGDGLTVIVPPLTEGVYMICVYSSGNALIAKSPTAAASKYTAVAAGAGELDKAVVRDTDANKTVTLTDTDIQFGDETVVQFNRNDCPAVYAAPAAGISADGTGTTVNVGGGRTAVTTTVPSTLAGLFSVCAYTENVAGRALVARANAALSLLHTITLVPAIGPTAGTNVVTATAANAVFTGTPRVQFTLFTCPDSIPSTRPGLVVNALDVAMSGGGTILTFTAPPLLATSYQVCVYQEAGTDPGQGNRLIAQSAEGAYTAAITGDLTLAPAYGSAVGGEIVTLTHGTAKFGATTAVQLNPSGCPAKYPAATGPILSATVDGAFVADGSTIPVVTPALTGSSYYLCVYTDDQVGVSALVTGTATAAFNVRHAMALDLTHGPATGGYTIGAAVTAGTIPASVAVRFVSGVGCPDVYGTPTTGQAAATTTNAELLTITVPALTAGTYTVCAYRGNAADSVLAMASTGQFGTRATQRITLSSTSGKQNDATNSFTATITGEFDETVANTWVHFNAAASCPATASGPPDLANDATGDNVLADTVRRIAPGNRLLVTTQAMANDDAYKVCVYASGADNAALVAESTVSYNVVEGVTITSISPAAGPAQGGTTIRVNGTGFAEPLTATVDGAALEIVEVQPTFFRAKTPPHAPATNLSIAVTVRGQSDTETNAFTYSYGVELSRNNAPNTAPVDISVSGVGFSQITFSNTAGATPAHGSGHVYLVRGEYDPTSVSGMKANDMVLECVDVLVIGDTELVCSLNLDGSGNRPMPTADPNGAGNATIDVGSNELTVVGAGFEAAHVGYKVEGTGLPAGTSIVQVLSSERVILSDRATVGMNADAGAASFTTRKVTVTPTDTDTLPLGDFTAADEGAPIAGPLVRPGTTISAVDADATLSKTLTWTAGATDFVVNASPVPTGAYTITVVNNGAVGATVSQSIITSGSTFTVAEY